MHRLFTSTRPRSQHSKRSTSLSVNSPSTEQLWPLTHTQWHLQFTDFSFPIRFCFCWLGYASTLCWEMTQRQWRVKAQSGQCIVLDLTLIVLVCSQFRSYLHTCSKGMCVNVIKTVIKMTFLPWHYCCYYYHFRWMLKEANYVSAFVCLSVCLSVSHLTSCKSILRNFCEKIKQNNGYSLTSYKNGFISWQVKILFYCLSNIDISF